MITYSQAGSTKCPDRKSFTDCVLNAFNFQPHDSVQPLHWAVCREPHKDCGFHYHMCIKLSGNKRWLGAKTKLLNDGINVNFTEGNRNYVPAYRYVKNFDDMPLHSDAHPDLELAASTKTSKMMQVLMKKRRSASS